MQPGRGSALAAAALAVSASLASCSSPSKIRADRVGGEIVFSRVGADGCSDRFVVSDQETGATLWHIGRTWAHPLGERPPVCRDIFPLTYGRSPPGFREAVSPMPLAPGRPYLMVNEDEDGERFAGAFTTRSENMPPPE